MAKIFYSVMGEGRGHATRARALAEQLRDRHQLTLLAPEDAYRFLAPLYNDDPSVRVREIPGLRFHYTERRMDLIKTVRRGVRFRIAVGRHVRQLEEIIDREKPDLAITDFEPLLPRAAVRRGIPYLSIDHQHFLLAYDLSALPKKLRRYAKIMGLVVRAFHRWQAETVVSGFFFPPLRPGFEHVTQVGGLFRPELLAAEPYDGEHVVSYLRTHTPKRVLEALHNCGREVRVYGLGARAAEGRLRFCEIHEQNFIRDLASCQAMIGAAGNQLIGESLYLGKPVLALPESHHHEQIINAHFLEMMGCGAWSPPEALTREDMHSYLERGDEFREKIAGYRDRLNGTPAAVAVIERHLANMDNS